MELGPTIGLTKSIFILNKNISNVAALRKLFWYAQYCFSNHLIFVPYKHGKNDTSASPLPTAQARTAPIFCKTIFRVFSCKSIILGKPWENIKNQTWQPWALVCCHCHCRWCEHERSGHLFFGSYIAKNKVKINIKITMPIIFWKWLQKFMHELIQQRIYLNSLANEVLLNMEFLLYCS